MIFATEMKEVVGVKSVEREESAPLPGQEDVVRVVKESGAINKKTKVGFDNVETHQKRIKFIFNKKIPPSGIFETLFLFFGHRLDAFSTNFLFLAINRFDLKIYLEFPQSSNVRMAPGISYL